MEQLPDGHPSIVAFEAWYYTHGGGGSDEHYWGSRGAWCKMHAMLSEVVQELQPDLDSGDSYEVRAANERIADKLKSIIGA